MSNECENLSIAQGAPSQPVIMTATRPLENIDGQFPILCCLAGVSDPCRVEYLTLDNQWLPAIGWGATLHSPSDPENTLPKHFMPDALQFLGNTIVITVPDLLPYRQIRATKKGGGWVYSTTYDDYVAHLDDPGKVRLWSKSVKAVAVSTNPLGPFGYVVPSSHRCFAFDFEAAAKYGRDVLKLSEHELEEWIAQCFQGLQLTVSSLQPGDDLFLSAADTLEPLIRNVVKNADALMNCVAEFGQAGDEMGTACGEHYDCLADALCKLSAAEDRAGVPYEARMTRPQAVNERYGESPYARALTETLNTSAFISDLALAH